MTHEERTAAIQYLMDHRGFDRIKTGGGRSVIHFSDGGIVEAADIDEAITKAADEVRLKRSSLPTDPSPTASTRTPATSRAPGASAP